MLHRRYPGLAHRHNWLQLVRFMVVGATGFVLNLAIYSVLVHGVAIDYILAAVLSNSVVVAINYLLHRHWTFNASDDRKRAQGSRFLLVCAVGGVINLLVLRVGVEALGIPKVPAEALAAMTAFPVTFLLNRQWAFRSRLASADQRGKLALEELPSR